MKKHNIIIENFNNNFYYQLNNQMFLQLVNLINKSPYGYVRSLVSNCSKKEYIDYSELREWIDNVIPLEIKHLKYSTKCYWIIHNITSIPICKNDNCQNKIIKDIAFFGKYPLYCCNKCERTSKYVKLKRIQTNLKKRGVEYPTQSKQVIETRQKNNRAKYGTNEPCQCDSIKQQMKNKRLKKYNGKWESDESKKKRQQTNLKNGGHISNLHRKDVEQNIKNKWTKKYDGGHPLSDKRIRKRAEEKCLEKYGVKSFSQSQQFKDLWQNEEWKNNSLNKQHATKRKNNSFHTSKLEDDAYKFLIQFYHSHDVIRQYKSNEYPFLCDFYINSLKLYIECNFGWIHGGHQFNKYSKEDQMKLKKWKSKNTKYYKNAIYTWTVRDVKKLNIAKSNNINYKCIYSFDEFKMFILTLNKNKFHNSNNKEI